jgi:hypothetical protein
MEEQAQKSCWSVATWTVLALAGVLILAYIFGGFEATAPLR